MAEQYGIGRSTISDIKWKETELRQYKTSMKEMGRSAKVMKCGKDVELEKVLFVVQAEAVASLDKSLVWLQDQVECNTYNFSLLQSLQEIAARDSDKV